MWVLAGSGKKRGTCSGGFIIIIVIFYLPARTRFLFALIKPFVRASHGQNEVLAHLLSGVNELSRWLPTRGRLINVQREQWKGGETEQIARWPQSGSGVRRPNRHPFSCHLLASLEVICKKKKKSVWRKCHVTAGRKKAYIHTSLHLKEDSESVKLPGFHFFGFLEVPHYTDFTVPANNKYTHLLHVSTSFTFFLRPSLVCVQPSEDDCCVSVSPQTCEGSVLFSRKLKHRLQTEG